MTHSLSLSSTLKLLDPFDTQKESMNLLVNSLSIFAKPSYNRPGTTSFHFSVLIKKTSNTKLLLNYFSVS